MINKKILSERYVERLYDLFRKKNWLTEEIGENSTFDRFCSRLAELQDDSERDLIMELTEQFLWVKSDMYEKYLLEALRTLFSSKEWNHVKGTNIYICPLLPEREFGKLKSNTYMLYMCQSILIRTFAEFSDEQVRICETPEVLKEHKEYVGELILIDDFIGSGETALECLAYLDFLKEKREKTYIISLVAQKEGIENISKEKVKVYTSSIRNKGISDRYPEEEAKEKIKKMKDIGKSIKAPRNLSLGYLDTESLVAMIKTPNNTFPVYWCENKQGQKAPFPRKQNIKIIGRRNDKDE